MLLRTFGPSVPARLSPLFNFVSPAEFELLPHLRRGLTNKEIANELHKSQATIKGQVASILRKLETPTRGGLIAWLYEHPHPAVFP